MRINVLVNLHRVDAIEAARSTTAFLKSRGVSVGSDRDAAPLLDAEVLSAEEIGRADLVVSFGGDGTLIRSAHICSAHGTPILGVYFGRFGFVTQCSPEEIGAALSLFFDGQHRVLKRMMVQAELLRNGRVVAALHSLNEVALQRSAMARMLHFEVKIDGQFLNSYPADGVLIATPTGSTAYNLSAGGPIVDPSMECMVLTPVTPHSLSTRPIVLSPECEIELSMETRGDAVLSCDGQSRLQMLSGDVVRVTRSPRITNLVTLDEHDFLNKVSERLFWLQRDPPEGD